VKLSKKDKIEMLNKMIKIRLFEEEVYRSYTRNLIHGSIHLYDGEEAVAVGACAVLKPN